jgi:hypothetical protein
MTATVQGTGCPTWCQHHLNDDNHFDGTIHQRTKSSGGEVMVVVLPDPSQRRGGL